MNPAAAQETRGRDGARLSKPRTGDLRWRVVLLFAVLGWLWFFLCRQLSYEWSANEQYSYGWFVPFFALFLFWLRLEESGKLTAENGNWSAASRLGVEQAQSGQLKTETNVSARPALEPLKNFRFQLSVFSFFLLVALLPIRLFEIANPDWRPLSWGHALVVVGYSLLVIGYWGGKRAVWHFAFPVCFILVAVPWLTPIEAPLVQGLMRLVAAVATETLTLFGIPAQLEGSLIRVSNGVVGVSEACSGVRSLQTSLMIGLLFGELKRLTVARRFLLIGAALAIALFANFGRAFFLVWIAATENLAAVERWHDIAGYAIVGLVFVGTVGIASKLAKGRSKKEELRKTGGDLRITKDEGQSGIGGGEGLPRDPIPPFPLRVPHFRFFPSSFILLTFSWLLLVEVSVSSWYRWHERLLVPAPRWTVEWPQDKPALRDLKIDDHTRDMLRFDTGREVSWKMSAQDGADSNSGGRAEPARVAFLYFFRWEPGTATVLRARAHRPDICLPATGWLQVGAPRVRSYSVAAGFALPFRLFRFERASGDGRTIYADAFFCLREDRVAPAEAKGTVTPQSDWSIADRWKAVRNGLRNPGQQVMEFAVLSARQRSDADTEAEFARLLPQLVKEEGRIKKDER